MVYGPYSLEEQARQAFNQMMNRGVRHRLMNKLTGKRQSPLAFNELRQEISLSNQADRGIQTITVRQIVGSVGRINDFDDEFHLVAEDLQQRWLAVAKVLLSGQELPPIDVYKLDENYFVIDGNHRVSVVKTLGRDYIEARVIEIHQVEERCQTQEMPAPRFER